MKNFKKNRETITWLAGEGDFFIYRRNRLSQRLFVFLKHTLNSLAYFLFGRDRSVDSKYIFLVKGQNQLRLHLHAQHNFPNRTESTLFRVPVLFGRQRMNGAVPWMKIDAKSLFLQLWFLSNYLMTGKKRGLNLYFMSYQAAMEASIKRCLKNLETFVCYNDQNYEASSIILALKRLTLAKTIVFQHGLILNPKFYFPTNADEFWAWGDGSKNHFYARNGGSRLTIGGRFLDDKKNKAPAPYLVGKRGQPAILIVPSPHHTEILELINAVLRETGTLTSNFKLGIKLHPATKFKALVVIFCKIKGLAVESVDSDISNSASYFDAMVTRNSTSAVDFLLRGKCVFVDDYTCALDFPSPGYTFPLYDLKRFLSGDCDLIDSNHLDERLKFLKNTINV